MYGTRGTRTEIRNVPKILIERHQANRPLGKRMHAEGIILSSMFENTEHDAVILNQMPHDRNR